jgi:hypothetical protein
VSDEAETRAVAGLAAGITALLLIGTTGLTLVGGSALCLLGLGALLAATAPPRQDDRLSPTAKRRRRYRRAPSVLGRW